MRSMFRLRGMRTTQLLLLTLALAPPASALAFGGMASVDFRPPGRLVLRLADRHLRLGQRLAVSGRVSRSQAGRRIVLQRADGVHARWGRLASTRIDRRGRFAVRVDLRRSELVRAVEIAAAAVSVAQPRGLTRTETSGGAPLGQLRSSWAAAVSRATPVQVAARVQVTPREHAVLVGQPVQVAGRLAPARAGRRMLLQGHVGHGWRTLARARTGVRGGFAARWRPRIPIAQALRVVFAGDRVNAYATAGAGGVRLFSPTVVSWYSDAGMTACGYHAGLGVASRTLPCGTRVHLRHAGHAVTAIVDDRGPYVGGRTFDLNQTTAAALGFFGVGTIDASVG